MLSEVSQVQKDKSYMFSFKTDPKDKRVHKNKHDHIHPQVEYAGNSGTALWNLGEKEKEKRMIDDNTSHLYM
jgi:hypothetical protein